MKKIVVFGSFCLAASLLAAPYGVQTTVNGPASTETQANGGAKASQEFPKDRFTTTEDHKLGSQIHVQVAEIVGAPVGNAIILIVDEGDVKLIGKVPSEDAKRKIAQAVQQIKGVKSVHNKLEVGK